MDQTHLTGTLFATLGLDPRLLQGLHAAGFEYCTPIQAETLPLLLAGQDVAGQAQTGTGKTAAFVLAACERLLHRAGRAERPPHPPRAIVIAPTRELAIQIHQDAVTLGQFTGIRMGLVYGGIDYEKQRDMLLSGVDLLVGTPGRLIDYFKQRALDLHAIEVAVIDEADRMFDLGFIRDLRYLLRRMPKPEERLSMLFSATLSCRVHELAYEHMNNPQMVTIEPEKVTVDKVSQRLYHVESREKLSVLWNLLRALPEPRALIFVNTKRAAEYITEHLSRTGLEAGLVSGDVPQRERERLISRFGKGDLPFLVATDVAARGLHIPDVTHVFNYDLPQNAEDYVHRIGRTARAGASGQAISLACEEFVYSLAEIEAFIGDKIRVLPVTEDLLVPPPTPAGARPSHRRRPRHRHAA